MRETTPDERHHVMHDVIEDLGLPQNFDEMASVFREYQKRELMLRYDDADPEHMKDIERMAEFYAKMGQDFFIYDYPAIDYLLKNKDF